MLDFIFDVCCSFEPLFDQSFAFRFHFHSSAIPDVIFVQTCIGISFVLIATPIIHICIVFLAEVTVDYEVIGDLIVDFHDVAGGGVV